MENFGNQGTLGSEETGNKGFSKEQIQQLSFEDIEDLLMEENSDKSRKDNKPLGGEFEKGNQKDKKNPNEGGPRPPKEEEYPDTEDDDDDLFSEVSDPNEKD